ncbi:MAG: phosphatase PAP2 family protein [Candidatus Eremiobacteraeota bacterium]|nr:phosphatase PAP2 family protein [Candidatus Eremiobacteraeota bacterium]
MTIEARLWLIAAVAFGAFAVLGFVVSHAPPLRIDLEGIALRGRGVPIAALLTTSGRGPAVFFLELFGVLIAFLQGWNIRLAIAIGLSQLLSQGAVEAFKHVFARPRPDDWLVRHELGFSYPSGHATTVVVFFAAWLLFIAFTPLPRGAKVVAAVALLAWMFGIDWSRVALGAHYLTDVLGGTLFGVAWLSAMLALGVRLGLLAR